MDITAHIMKVGRWNGKAFDKAELQQMVDNFNALIDSGDHKPPLKLGHNDEQEGEIMRDGQPALGWVKKLVLKGNDLFAQFTDVPEILGKAIKAGRYRTVSVELWYKVRYLGKQIGTVLKAVSLLGADIPAVSGMKDLRETLEALLSKDTDNNSVSFEGSEECATFSFNVQDGEINERSESDMDLEKRIAELEEKFGKQSEALADANSRVEVAEKKAAESKAELEKFHKDAETKKQDEARENFNKSCEDMVEAGAMQPAFRDKVVKEATFDKDGGLLLPATLFSEYAEAHKELLSKDEKGAHKGDKPEGDEDSIDEKLHKATEAYAKEHDLEYSEAQIEVLAKDPEIAKAFSVITKEEGGNE